MQTFASAPPEDPNSIISPRTFYPLGFWGRWFSFSPDSAVPSGMWSSPGAVYYTFPSRFRTVRAAVTVYVLLCRIRCRSPQITYPVLVYPVWVMV